ncbi:MAG: RNA polymerase sporulation sigma factor SigH [Actinobacteria bacterium]|nr:RNA polymerase sporulation sigma factor SigH [Actinomycetota bacterium]
MLTLIKTFQNKTIILDDLSDNEIVLIAQSGNDLAYDYLISKYKSFVRLKTRSYFLVGADNEDILQEGMIGLYKAIRDFRSEKNASFKAFAEICIKRQILTAIKTATRRKHAPLNSYISLNGTFSTDESNERALIDMLMGESAVDPIEMMFGAEELKEAENNFKKKLSPFELKVFSLYLSGASYYEIAKKLEKRVKSIDNALQRIKHKGEVFLKNK